MNMASTPPAFAISMTAEKLIEIAKSQVTCAAGASNCSIRADDSIPIVPDTPEVVLAQHQLFPQTPLVLVENRQDAFSLHLQEFCLKNEICVVRGLESALQLDLKLFSTSSILQANPAHTIEIRKQFLQSNDENWLNGAPSWKFVSSRTTTTIADYAKYQNEMNSNSNSDPNNKIKNGQYPNMIEFGTNVDLSDESKWRAQLRELKKLPPFARLVSAGNMLSHVGHDILGMNTVQLYLKVPGARTPAHQENNNFCSININIGPGDCEWFGVANAYWGGVQVLCERNGLDYLKGSWWPCLKDLHGEKIPVYRFLQKPGDLVWVNSGCVHWVIATGLCNNIAWNVGPLTARQYQLAIERYEWNKPQHFKSIVPMIHLSWKLARNIGVTDPILFKQIKTCLMKTLVQCVKVLEIVRSKNVQIRFQEKQKNEPSHYCGKCEVEVFNLLFTNEQTTSHGYVVHCIGCALKQNSNLYGFTCLQEFGIPQLKSVYDKFMLHKEV